MNLPQESLGPVARMEERPPLSDALRHRFADATPGEIEVAIQRLPPQDIETFRQLRRLKEEILAWRGRFRKPLRAS